jgi:Tol biopolymer transport system component
LERIIQRALQKEPERRFQSTADLKLELLEIKEEPESGRVISAEQVVRQETKRPRRFWPWVAGLLAALGIGFAIWLALSAIRPDRPPPRTLYFTSLEGREDWPALSPDGTRVAFSWDGGDVKAVSELYVKAIGAGDPLQLTFPPGGGRTPTWSPDGSRIAFTRGSRGDYSIFEIPALGGAERPLGTSIAWGWPHLSWSPVGTQLAVRDKASPESPNAVFLLSRETGEKRQLSNPPPSRGAPWVGDKRPVFSPDGRSVAFIRVGPGWIDNNDLYLVEVLNGEETRLTFDHALIKGVDWSPDGRQLVFSSGRGEGIRNLWRIPRSGGEPTRLGVGEDALAISTSREGSRLVYARSTTDYNLWRVSGPTAAERTGPTRIVASSREDSRPSYSPDGSRIAFRTNRSGRLEIWVCDSSGGNCRFLTPGGSPAWSPDGERLVFTTRLKEVGAISIIDAEGGFSHLLVDEGINFRSHWSRDGQWVYFRSFRTDKGEIWKIRPDGEGLRRVTSGGAERAVESEDGRFLYYETRDPVHASRIWRMPVDGGEASLVLDGLARSPHFFAVWNIWRGFLIYYTHEGEASPSIESLDLETGAVKTLAPLGPDAFLGKAGLNVSPDGQWIVYANRDTEGSDLILVENFYLD